MSRSVAIASNLSCPLKPMTMVRHPRVQLSSATSSSLWPIAILLLLSTSTVTTAFYTPHHYLLYTNIMSSSSTKIQQSSTSSSTNNEMVQTEELLSTIIHAATYGSHTISSLSDEARNGHIQFKEEGDARSALTGKKCLFIAVCTSCVCAIVVHIIYLVYDYNCLTKICFFYSSSINTTKQHNTLHSGRYISTTCHCFLYTRCISQFAYSW